MKRQIGLFDLGAIQTPRKRVLFNSQSTTGNAMLHGNTHESVTLAFVKQANCISGPGMNVNGKGQMRVNALPRFGQPFFQWRRPPNVQCLFSAQKGHRAQHSRQTQDVVAMHVADENALELLKSALVLSKGQLHPLSCIDEVGMPVDVQELRRGASRRNRHCRSRPEKHHVKCHGDRRLSLNRDALRSDHALVLNAQNVQAFRNVTHVNRSLLLRSTTGDSASIGAHQLPLARTK